MCVNTVIQYIYFRNLWKILGFQPKKCPYLKSLVSKMTLHILVTTLVLVVKIPRNLDWIVSSPVSFIQAVTIGHFESPTFKATVIAQHNGDKIFLKSHFCSGKWTLILVWCHWWIFEDKQKYSRLRCLLHVKDLVICFIWANLAVLFQSQNIW